MLVWDVVFLMDLTWYSSWILEEPGEDDDMAKEVGFKEAGVGEDLQLSHTDF